MVQDNGLSHRMKIPQFEKFWPIDTFWNLSNVRFRLCNMPIAKIRCETNQGKWFCLLVPILALVVFRSVCPKNEPFCPIFDDKYVWIKKPKFWKYIFLFQAVGLLINQDLQNDRIWYCYQSKQCRYNLILEIWLPYKLLIEDPKSEWQTKRVGRK